MHHVATKTYDPEKYYYANKVQDYKLLDAELLPVELAS